MSANNITTSPLTDFALLFGSVLLAHTKMESARAARHAQTRSTIMMVGCTGQKTVLRGGQIQHHKTLSRTTTRHRNLSSKRSWTVNASVASPRTQAPNKVSSEFSAASDSVLDFTHDLELESRAWWESRGPFLNSPSLPIVVSPNSPHYRVPKKLDEQSYPCGPGTSHPSCVILHWILPPLSLQLVDVRVALRRMAAPRDHRYP